jgi:phosphoglycerate dehydrogenase-like enzyme
MKKYKIAVLDDYQNVAFESADWSVLRDRADIAVFHDHFADPDALIERLLPFDVVCVMRERTPLPRNVIGRLPNLKLIASTGSGNASVSSRVSNCSLTAAEPRSNRAARRCAEEYRYGLSNHSDDGFAQRVGRITEGNLLSRRR